MEKLATLLLAKRPSEQHVNQYREGPPPCPHRKATPRRESPDCTNGKTGRATEQLSSQQKRNFLFHLLLILRGCSVARRGFSIIRSRCSLSCFFCSLLSVLFLSHLFLVGFLSISLLVVFLVGSLPCFCWIRFGAPGVFRAISGLTWTSTFSVVCFFEGKPNSKTRKPNKKPRMKSQPYLSTCFNIILFKRF